MKEPFAFFEKSLTPAASERTKWMGSHECSLFEDAEISDLHRELDRTKGQIMEADVRVKLANGKVSEMEKEQQVIFLFIFNILKTRLRNCQHFKGKLRKHSKRDLRPKEP